MNEQCKEKLGFLCCFCKQGIAENTIDPIDINIATNDDIKNKTGCNQFFFSHSDCFKRKLHQYFKGYFIGDLYEDDNLIVKNKDHLIKKITEFENVDSWKVIYYGLTREFINPQFVLEYCYALIEKTNCADQFVLDIAALFNKDDLYNLPQTNCCKNRPSRGCWN